MSIMWQSARPYQVNQVSQFGQFGWSGEVDQVGRVGRSSQFRDHSVHWAVGWLLGDRCSVG